MGFIKGNIAIEDWLLKFDFVFDTLTDLDYRKLLVNWRASFEEKIVEKNHVFQGEKAMYAVESELPCNAYIFNFPGSKLLPASINAKRKVYGFKVKHLNKIDRNLFNTCDVIICDEEYKFTCLYTHEWTSLALPKYYGGGSKFKV